ncbi:putative lipase [Leishmania major strain Friedlin]|uniref:Putative lipase n=1 Tax=Leishmania major TaxID=5664 RepID=Q4Q615_LEIMA|nr:putative lipase [Leishmania major strain Friedlin]CAG9579424.1 lipase_-_putative [Leishmania major strain Friedlin]CAJ08439.1 putative lipase [Leishmania major strain Friedlin]|eukprot:XP_001685233.1 putative lipase [Leishmania major strain Friedlin]
MTQLPKLVCFTTVVAGLIVLLTLYTVSTLRTADGDATVVGVNSAGYSVTDGWKALHFSKAAYCDVADLRHWGCGVTCANATPEFQVFNIYENNSTGNVGYSGVDHDAKRIVVAFRGTYNTVNWLQNLDFRLTSYPHPGCGNGCKIHRGFYKAYSSLRAQMIDDVLLLHARYPLYTLFITGHSLGGAMAMLAAVELATWNMLEGDVLGKGVQSRSAASPPLHLAPVELYTFGEPRVGNGYFSNWSLSVLTRKRSFRLTHAKDPVPHVPPRLFTYVHTPQEVWYPTDDEKYHLCQGTGTSEDPLCSDSVLGTKVSDHLIYLGICTRCECTAEEMEKIYSYELPPEIYNIIALDHAMNNPNFTGHRAL